MKKPEIQLQCLFIQGVGRVDGSAFLKYARKLFKEYKNELTFTRNGSENSPESSRFKTTLREYADAHGCVEIITREDAKELKVFLENNAKAYLESLGYDIQKYNVAVERLWLNEMERNQFHIDHAHVGKFISGCFYVDMPKDCPGITYTGYSSRFDRMMIDVKEYTPFNSATWKLEPIEGDVFFWESYLTHGVSASEFNGVRRSIAFDIMLYRI